MRPLSPGSLHAVRVDADVRSDTGCVFVLVDRAADAGGRPA